MSGAPLALSIDHLVVAVSDLGAAADRWRALGFTVRPGGRHPGRTSHNALVVFADGSYLELIAWTAFNAAERWCVEHARHGDGPMDLALLPDETGAALARARSRGLEMDGPVDGGRLRPDGVEVKWRTARQRTFDLPFLCGDVTPRGLRVPEGEARAHANGALGIASVTMAVSDLAVSIARWRALAGDEASIEELSCTVASAGLRIAQVRLGAQSVLLASPEGEAASDLARRVAGRLATRGEGPVALSLRFAPGAAVPSFADPAATDGVPVDVAR